MKTVTKAEAQRMLDEGRISSTYFGSKKKKYTILMPKEAAQNWLAALRSGEYIQTAASLHNPNTGGFCCLGVEQYCNNDGFVENTFEEYGKSGSFLGYPSSKYQDERGYLFVDQDNTQTGNPLLRLGRTANLNDDTTFIEKKVNQHGTKQVKVHKNSFETMADYLEEKMLVY